MLALAPPRQIEDKVPKKGDKRLKEPLHSRSKCPLFEKIRCARAGHRPCYILLGKKNIYTDTGNDVLYPRGAVIVDQVECLSGQESSESPLS
jgi:hypothetical protein